MPLESQLLQLWDNNSKDICDMLEKIGQLFFWMYGHSSFEIEIVISMDYMGRRGNNILMVVNIRTVINVMFCFYWGQNCLGLFHVKKVWKTFELNSLLTSFSDRPVFYVWKENHSRNSHPKFWNPWHFTMEIIPLEG